MTDETASPPALHLYVWRERFLFVGPSQATTMHRNHAAVWLTARDGLLRVTLADNTVLEGEAIYLPSGTEYATAPATAAVAALFWEPESDSFKRIAARFDHAPHGFRCPLRKQEDWQMLQDPATSLAQAHQLIAAMFGMDLSAGDFHAFMDARVQSAIDFLQESPQHYGSLDALAEEVHLSPSRLAHLFKNAVGVPVRRYVLWQKLRRALDLALTGDSLTTAALSAGFADSAHLSRTVRSMLGIAPEFLFRHRERLIVHR